MDAVGMLGEIRALMEHHALPMMSSKLQDRLVCAHYKKLMNRVVEIDDAFPCTGKEAAEIYFLTQYHTFLQENWTLIKGTPLGYTVCPDSDATKLCIAIARFVYSNKHLLPKDTVIRSEIDCLMPGITLESVADDYPDLCDSGDGTFLSGADSIRSMLRTHILSASGDALIPVRELTHWELDAGRQQRLRNPYFDFSSGQGSGYLTDDEISRLFRHSEDTALIASKIQDYERAVAAGVSLLGHLKVLCARLYLYSVSGLGSERNAAGGVYDAIIVFADYYRSIERQHSQIPDRVRKEIERLLELSADPDENNNANGGNVETCIALRRQSLLRALTTHEKALADIVQDEKEQVSAIPATTAAFEAAVSGLKQSIDTGQYSGCDTAAMTLSLLNTLNVNPRIQSGRDLELFCSLSADDISRLLTESLDLKKSLFAWLRDPDRLVMFLIDTPEDKLKSVLDVLGKEIARGIFEALGQDSFLVFKFLSPEKCRMLAENALLSGRVSHKALNRLLQELDSAQIQAIFSGAPISRFVASRRHFNRLLRCPNAPLIPGVPELAEQYYPTDPLCALSLRLKQAAITGNVGIARALGERCLEVYLKDLEGCDDSHHKRSLTLFGATLNFGCSVGEKRAAVAALRWYLASGDVAVLQGHEKALRRGRLKIIRRVFMQFHRRCSSDALVTAAPAVH